MKQQIREIAKMLAEDPPKEEKARIKSEALIRDDNTVEAYEILQLNCELLSERIHLITHSKECPQDLVSSISTLIWASGKQKLIVHNGHNPPLDLGILCSYCETDNECVYRQHTQLAAD